MLSHLGFTLHSDNTYGKPYGFSIALVQTFYLACMEGESPLCDCFLNETAHPDEELRHSQFFLASPATRLWFSCELTKLLGKWDPISLTFIARWQCSREAGPIEILNLFTALEERLSEAYVGTSSIYFRVRQEDRGSGTYNYI